MPSQQALQIQNKASRKPGTRLWFRIDQEIEIAADKEVRIQKSESGRPGKPRCGHIVYPDMFLARGSPELPHSEFWLLDSPRY